MKKVLTKEELLDRLKRRFPKCWFKDGTLFSNNYSTAIWSGSDGTIRGKKMIDPYATSKLYILEVHYQLNNFLERHGWYAEMYDAGTVMFYPIVTN